MSDEITVDPAAVVVETENEAEAPEAASGAVAGFARRLISGMDLLCGVLMAVTLAGSCGIAFGNVVDRVLLGSSLTWSDTACEIGLAVLAFLGAVGSFIRGDHAGLRGLASRLSGRRLTHLAGATNGIILICAVVLMYQGLTMVTDDTLGVFPATGWPTVTLYVPLTAGGVLLTATAAARFLSRGTRHIPWPGLVFAGAAAGAYWWFVQKYAVDISQVGAIAIAGVVIAATIALGTPIAFAMLLGAIAGILLQKLPFNQVPLQMTNEMTQVSLLTLPLFILVGILYAQLGYSDNLAEVFRRIGRRIPAADGMAMVGAMFVFSGLSGSKLADVSAVGQAFVGGDQAPDGPDREKKAGRQRTGRAETSGILSASAVMGEVIAPSIALLVLGSVATVSTGALFVAGLLPAVITGIAIIAVAMLRSRRLPSAHQDGTDQTPMLHLVVRGLPALGGIVMIAGSVVSGFATAEEASAVAAVYSLLLAAVYRIPLRAVLKAVLNAARLSGMLLFIIASVGVLSWFLTVSGLSTYVADLSNTVHGNAALFMVALIVVLIVLGSAFEGLPAIILLAPVLIPQASQLGIDQLQASITVLLAMGIGIFLPPLGNGFYTSCVACRVPPEAAVRSTLVYMLPVVAATLVVAFVPAVSTWLPHVLGVAGE